MKLQHATGIALSQKDTGEADVICTYYTHEFGKRSFIFKGLRKTRRRSRAVVEPGVTAHLVFYDREGIDTCIVKESDIVAYHPSIGSDLRRIFHLLFMLEVVEKSSAFLAADSAVYRLLSMGIEALSTTPYPTHLVCFCILRLMKAQGILAQFGSCKSCGKPIEGSFSLDPVDFRSICRVCLVEGGNPSHLVSPTFRPAIMEYLQSCLSSKFGSIEHSRIPDGDVLNCIYVLTLFLERYLRRELKSKSFILSERYAGESASRRDSAVP